jgi:mercuric ion transport protein
LRAIAAALAGSVLSGLLASACCLGPLVLTFLGVSGAALAHRFEALRPFLLLSTYGLLAAAFYLTYRPRQAECLPGDPCAIPRAGRVGKLMLWIGAVLAVLLTAFPWYSQYLF